MGTSYAQFRGQEFEAHDADFEVLLHLAVEEIDKLDPPAWLLEMREHWDVISTQGFGYGVWPDLARFVTDDERRDIVVSLFERVLHRLKEYGEFISPDELNAMGTGGQGSFFTVALPAVEFKGTAEKFIKLLRGELEAGPDHYARRRAGSDNYRSVVDGYIIARDSLQEENMRAIIESDLHVAYPLTSVWISGLRPGESYTIWFSGYYHFRLEEHWNEWLWRFSQLLLKLEASVARANLNCDLGYFVWKLQPYSSRFGAATASSKGEQWGITKAPENDFSIDLPGRPRYDSNSKWDKFVERWLE